MNVRRAALGFVTPGIILRAVLAAGLAIDAFLALWDRFEGDCMIPDYSRDRRYLFIALAGLFFAGFVWLVSELAYPLLPGKCPSRRAAALAVGVAVYGSVAFAVWLSNPDTSDTAGNGFREFMSLAWPAGMLLKTGAFSDYSCGY